MSTSLFQHFRNVLISATRSLNLVLHSLPLTHNAESFRIHRFCIGKSARSRREHEPQRDAAAGYVPQKLADVGMRPEIWSLRVNDVDVSLTCCRCKQQAPDLS